MDLFDVGMFSVYRVELCGVRFMEGKDGLGGDKEINYTGIQL